MMITKLWKDRDFIGGCSLCLVSLFIMQQSLTMSFTEHPGTLSPRFFPLMISIVLLGLSIRVLIEPFLKKQSKDAPENQSDNYKLIVVMMLCMFVYIVLLKYAGFFVSTIAYLIFLMQVLKATSLLKSVLLSFIITGLIFIIFSNLFEVILPTGYWFGG